MAIIDLTQTISSTMQIYPGDPIPVIDAFLDHDTDCCHVAAIHIGTHTGTHVDAPFHFIKTGKTISDYPLDRFIGEGVLLDVSGRQPDEPIREQDIADDLSSIEPGNFVIFKTGWDRHWGREGYAAHPYLSPGLAGRLVDCGVSLVAIDALNVDPTSQNRFPVHKILLGNDVLIVENICNLTSVHEKSGRYLFLPLKLKGTDGAPVRAVYLGAAGTRPRV